MPRVETVLSILPTKNGSDCCGTDSRAYIGSLVEVL